MPRFFVNLPLVEASALVLPRETARHAQVLRLQPGDEVDLFDGLGAQWRAKVLSMGGRSEVEVQLLERSWPLVELGFDVTLALGMPANDRMDALVEKAAELGAAGIQPLVCERSVLRLDGERAAKRVAHWAGVATAASEQSGRVRLPKVHGVMRLGDWLGGLEQPAEDGAARFVLSFAADSRPLKEAFSGMQSLKQVTLLSGPEGGLSPAEEAMALGCGFAPVTLGPRVLRADTAPLAALAVLGALTETL
ncbi:MAG: 16S rRNA (uracil(1498)-N(3))-methyltransferase [Pseudomonadota bacterium]